MSERVRTKPFKWTIEVEVAPVWVEDGFNLTEERAQSVFLRELGWARSDEVTCKVVKAPSRKSIRKIQGYDDTPKPKPETPPGPYATYPLGGLGHPEKLKK